MVNVNHHSPEVTVWLAARHRPRPWTLVRPLPRWSTPPAWTLARWPWIVVMRPQAFPPPRPLIPWTLVNKLIVALLIFFPLACSPQSTLTAKHILANMEL